MLIRNYVPFKEIIKRNWVTFIAVTGYASLLTYIYNSSDAVIQELLHIPSFITSILGTSLAFFLGFITNSAYDRWWEARKRWGTIVNDSRNIGRQFYSFIQVQDAQDASRVKGLVKHQIAWCYSVKHQLRKQDASASMQRLIGRSEAQRFAQFSNPANAIMIHQSEELARFKKEGKLGVFESMQIDETMSRLIDHMGANERIKNTIFPTQYSFFVHLFIILFLILVPHGAVETMGWYCVPLTALLAFVYLMIETIEISMQDPYDMEPSDTPMSAICRIIEIDLLEMLKEDKIPKPVLPVDGILH